MIIDNYKNIKQKKYSPFLKGKYDVGPGVLPLKIDFNNSDLHEKAFQIDQNIIKHLENKRRCREDNINKYYHTYQENPETIKSIIDFIIYQLTSSYPDYFQLKKDNDNSFFYSALTEETICFNQQYELISNNKYLNLFDALLSQVAEDITVFQLTANSDYLSTGHLCSASSWNPEEKVGKNFFQVHEIVPGMEIYKDNYFNLLKGLINKSPFYRFVWEFNTDKILNHSAINDISVSNPPWIEKPFDPDNPELYIRVERQAVVGFPQNNAFILIVKVFNYDMADLTIEDINGIENTVNSMSAETIDYKRFYQHKEILHYLNSLKEKLIS
jgi:hypothetical protein